MNNMEKNNQPLILGTIAVGAVLIIALALIFTRSGDDAVLEITNENNTAENEENNNEGDNGEDSQQPAPNPTPQPSPQPAPIPAPNPTPAPNPQPGVLPSNWDGLTAPEKTNLNPFDCDHETQWVSAEDGSCIDKPAETSVPAGPEPEQTFPFQVFLGYQGNYPILNCNYGRSVNLCTIGGVGIRATSTFSVGNPGSDLLEIGADELTGKDVVIAPEGFLR